jgi:hypothetical protein
MRVGVSNEADRVAELCLVMSQAHFRAAAHWRRWRDVLGLPAVLLAALTSVAAFSQVPNSGVLAGSIAVVVALLTAANSYMDPSKKAEKYWAAGVAYRVLRDQTVRFRTIQAVDVSLADEVVARTLEELASRLDQLHSESPVADADLQGFLYQLANERHGLAPSPGQQGLTGWIRRTFVPAGEFRGFRGIYGMTNIGSHGIGTDGQLDSYSAPVRKPPLDIDQASE